ncbi:MAG TPA: FliH/SctL family protein [Candidatus Saccharimonadales bacterium]|nr:FliH/SctL family protein [Candidatus Saccharimonadales bacterium]
MNSWSETITLPTPLRDASPAGFLPGLTHHDVSLQTQWQAGYEQGRIDGEKALSEQLIAQRAELHELVNGAVASMRQTIPQIVRETENALVALALEVARKLISEMPISAPMVEAAVRDALAQVESTAETTVRLHPADLELLQNAGSPLISSPDAPREFRFLSSPDVSRGGCLVQTNFGTVDARRETKFDLIKKNVAL